MQTFDSNYWAALTSLVKADDGEAIRSLAAADQVRLACALQWHDPLDADARTPLMLAYWLGRPIAATALVNAGAVYEQHDAHGHDASWYARRFGNGALQESMSRLVESGERRISMEKVFERRASEEGLDQVRGQARSKSRRLGM